MGEGEAVRKYRLLCPFGRMCRTRAGYRVAINIPDSVSKGSRP
jgi:hypothetical protein